MLIIGAKGFAKEVLEILHQNNDLTNFCFYDDVSGDLPEFLFNKFRILTNLDQAESYFNKINDFSYSIGVGGPVNRYRLMKKFEKIGGQLKSTISPFAHIGHYGNQIKKGCNIMTGTIITNDINIGVGCLINLNCTIGHDSVINNFVEMAPGVHISGYCNIGEFTNIGTNATILPKVTIGANVIIGAGSVVTKNMSSNSLVVGIPGKVLKDLTPIDLK